MDERARETRVGRAIMAIVAVLLVASWAWRRNLLWPSHPDAAWPRFVDVSAHQGVIDWPRVAGSGIAGAWIKATEGGDFTDARYAENREQAEAAGLPTGAYHFFTFCRPAEEQAAHFLDVVGADPGRLPPAVDVERGGNCAAVPAPVTLRSQVDAFLTIVEARWGRKLLVYVLADQLDLFEGVALPVRDLWVRDLFRAPVVEGRAVPVWQFHSRAWVEGIRGAADLDAVEPSAVGGWRIRSD